MARLAMACPIREMWSVIVRDFHLDDIDEIINLFRETVRSINIRDYSEAQVVAWAPDLLDRAVWLERLLRYSSVVAAEGGIVIGFAELATAGHLHTLFVHKDHQRRGVASALLENLETRARRHKATRMYTEASVTARPFFERRGYIVVQPQTVQLRGQSFTNYRMEKWLKEDAAGSV